MPPQTLTLRELNRATLARQLLLERHTLPIPAAIEKLIALQSQEVNPPYVGLWTRLSNFTKAALTSLIEQKQVVRAAMLRSTLHLATAADYLRFYHTIQPALKQYLQ